MAVWGKSSIKEDTYNVIKDKILHLVYQPGEPINLTQLEKELGISNTPVREAVSSLTAEGLLTSFHNSKIRVVKFDRTVIKELNDAVRAIMNGAVDLVQEQDHMEQLEDLLDDRYREQLSILVSDNDYFDYVTCAIRFDRAFVEATNNRYLVNAFDTMSNVLFLASMYFLSNGYMDTTKNREEHEELLNAVRQRDISKLKAALRQHYDNHIHEPKE